MFVQCFELQGRHFTNFHYYYYYKACECDATLPWFPFKLCFLLLVYNFISLLLEQNGSTLLFLGRWVKDVVHHGPQSERSGVNFQCTRPQSHPVQNRRALPTVPCSCQPPARVPATSEPFPQRLFADRHADIRAISGPRSRVCGSRSHGSRSGCSGAGSRSSGSGPACHGNVKATRAAWGCPAGLPGRFRSPVHSLHRLPGHVPAEARRPWGRGSHGDDGWTQGVNAFPAPAAAPEPGRSGSAKLDVPHGAGGIPAAPHYAQ